MQNKKFISYFSLDFYKFDTKWNQIHFQIELVH